MRFPYRSSTVKALIGAGLLVLVAACGASSTKDDAASKSTSTPTSAATKAPEGITEQTLVDALPDVADFPKGSLETVRCPGDDACTSASGLYGATASVAISPTLPAGAQPDRSSSDDRARFRVAGGEWQEEVKLRAWLYADEAEPAGYEKKYRGELEKLGPTVDVAPRKTGTGYDYGSRGTRSFEKLSFEGWKGFLQVQRVTYRHLDGRDTDPRIVVYGVLTKGKVYARIDTSYTVQGRSESAAAKAATEVLEDYVSRVDG